MTNSIGRKLAIGLAVAVVAGFAVERAYTCLESKSDGVHFNDEVPDFGVPPPVAVIPWWHEGPIRPGTVANYDLDSPTLGERHNANVLRRTLSSARAAEARHRYRAARRLYESLLDSGLGSPGRLHDRLEVLDARSHGPEPKLFAAYLRAADLYDDRGTSAASAVQKVMRRIAADPAAGFLRAHALYLLAALDSDSGDFDEAVRGFRRCAQLYPHSPRAESALIMAARTALGHGPHDQVRADRLVAGIGALEALLHRYPHTRFRAAALGWMASVQLAQGHTDSAIRTYERQMAIDGGSKNGYLSLAQCYRAKGRMDLAMVNYLRWYAHVKTARERVEAVWYLRNAGLGVNAAEIQKMSVVVRHDPALLESYLEFRLNFTDTGSKELGALARLADRTLRLHPRTRLSGLVLARLAEIGYLRKDYPAAAKYAARALRGRPTAEARSLALYVRGAVEARKHRILAAIADFEAVTRDPGSRLVGAARENLGLLYEKAGRFGDALEQYALLKYDDDVAYMLDVRMTPAQIASFIESHPRHGLRGLATYALGMRYLRRDQFKQASTWFHRLTGKERLSFAGLAKRADNDFGSPLQDPLETIRRLGSLNGAIRAARGPEAKAAAIYALAAYYRAKRDLLLYNPSLWHGGKASEYGFYWNRAVETSADRRAWHDHSYEHECLARTRSLCLEILRRFPKSKVAPAAAYTAATSCYHLADFNPWWRAEDLKAHLGEQAINLMRLVAKRYPKSQLAAPARKYGDVFVRELAERRRSGMF